MGEIKQGTRFWMPIPFEGIDFSTVEQIEFKFVQGSACKKWVYPSDTATLMDDNKTIKLLWTMADTRAFQPRKISMDTRIHIINSHENPYTPIVEFKMDPTLFTEEDDG